MKLKYTYSLEENYDQPRQHIKKQRHYFVNKHPSSQSYGFLVVMYQCERWTIKKAECWKIDAFELWCWRRLLRVPWTARTSNQFILKKSVVNIHWTDWCWSWSSNTLPPNVKNWLIWTAPDVGKDWRQEEKGTTEEMVGCHHQINGHEFKWTLGDAQGGLVCCSPCSCEESDTTEWLNWTELLLDNFQQATWKMQLNCHHPGSPSYIFIVVHLLSFEVIILVISFMQKCSIIIHEYLIYAFLRLK